MEKDVTLLQSSLAAPVPPSPRSATLTHAPHRLVSWVTPVPPRGCTAPGHTSMSTGVACVSPLSYPVTTKSEMQYLNRSSSQF